MPATTSTPTEVFPTPFFEGSEKRLELTFELGDAAPARGLRALPRDQLDAICTAAHCCIVSVCANEDVDAYVLSESSLFVFPTKLVMKTCGTTRLLDAVPLILELAAAIEAQPARARYSRASYLAAEHQVRGRPGCSFAPPGDNTCVFQHSRRPTTALSQRLRFCSAISATCLAAAVHT